MPLGTLSKDAKASVVRNSSQSGSFLYMSFADRPQVVVLTDNVQKEDIDKAQHELNLLKKALVES